MLSLHPATEATRAALATHGFSLEQTEQDGSLIFAGALNSRPAIVVALFLENRLSKILISLPTSEETTLPVYREMRSILDNVIAALDRIAALREQIREREADIRQFLREQLDGDEQQWAQNYLGSLLKVLRSGANSYIAQSQIIVSQANLNRYNVVSLLA